MRSRRQGPARHAVIIGQEWNTHYAAVMMRSRPHHSRASAHRGSGSNRPPADNFPGSPPACGRRRGPNRSACGRSACPFRLAAGSGAFMRRAWKSPQFEQGGDFAETHSGPAARLRCRKSSSRRSPCRRSRHHAVMQVEALEDFLRARRHALMLFPDFSGCAIETNSLWRIGAGGSCRASPCPPRPLRRGSTA